MRFENVQPDTVDFAPWPPGASDHAEKAGLEIEDSVLTGAVVYRSPDGTRATGLHRATPGRIKGRYAMDDVSVLLEGRLTVIEDGGEPKECATGDILFTSAGAVLEWIVHETTTRVWNAYNPDGIPF